MGLPVFGDEVVVILRDVADEVKCPSAVGLITEVGLVVEEVGAVFTFCLKRAEKVAVGLVAYAVAPSQRLGLETHISARAEQACRYVGLKFLRPFVSDVESRRHLVTILGFESSGRKTDFLYHVGVDDRESFLLTAPYEEWAVYLHIVDIDTVLIETSTTYVVL